MASTSTTASTTALQSASAQLISTQLPPQRPMTSSKTTTTTMAAVAPTPFAVKLVSGAVGGFVGTAVIYPLDLAKTRLQNQSSASATTATGAAAARYTGIMDVIQKTLRADGLTGLYRGLLPNLVGVLPEKALKLACNAQFRELLADGSTGRVSLPAELLAGALTGFVQCSITNPMEIIKIRMQTSKGASLGAVISELGFRGVYRGSAATLSRDVPFSVVFFTINAKGKEWYRLDEMESKERVMAWTLGLGTVAGVVAAVAVTPMDVIKTRLQTKPAPGQMPYTTIADTFTRVLKTEGPAAFFKGSSARALVVGPLFGMAVLSYSICEKIYHRYLR